MHVMPRNPGPDDYVEFLTTGTQAAGEYQCVGCGYGITIHSTLPACPMCSGETWEQVAWQPFSRAVKLQSQALELRSPTK